MFKNKTLLITGSTGSFGNSVLAYFLKGIKEIRIFSGGKKKQSDMRVDLHHLKSKFYLNSIEHK